MQENELTPKDLMRICECADYALILDGVTYAIKNTRLIPNSDGSWPVMQVEINDKSILPLLTGAMLGPSSEFTEILIIALGTNKHTIYANLTSYVQSSSNITLRLLILRAVYGQDNVLSYSYRNSASDKTS